MEEKEEKAMDGEYKNKAIDEAPENKTDSKKKKKVVKPKPDFMGSHSFM